ncbi:polysaccharide pyruvyl transferase [Arcobacter venerupis]|uniref:Polysaccharide pyruvyl transferase n=1 Tax=Arcobacter venerupis TaxID=1054033 RepID=A0AAE7E503_9BACT|nr:polysaccharide pyruvyl transferase family protein [Arcobacter venerupis]QKF67959.1 polysaccharide pyruvyl transferase [Arcobacter venerupis]
MKNIVLLNDTSFENHHGCNIVIENIKRNLEKRDIKLLATNPIGIDWKKNASFLNNLNQSDGVIINAEGTIHDDSDYAYSLLEIVNYTNKPCFLINMTYQNNSEKFSELVSKFRKIYVRETFSKKELIKNNIDSEVVPDMTFYALKKNYVLKDKKKVYITDSHDIKKSEKLYKIAEKNKITFLPIIAPFEKYSNLNGFFKKLKFNFFNNYGSFIEKSKTLKYKYKRFILVDNEDDLLENIRNSSFLISARFHAICLSLHFKVPFVAISSNTFKIESLLSDIGLNKRRIIDIKELNDFEKVNRKSNFFSKEELNKIEDYINDANKRIELMFNEINLIIENNDAK